MTTKIGTNAPILRVLEASKELLATPANWIQGRFYGPSDAEDTNDELNSPDHLQATCFCTVGALARASIDVAQKMGLPWREVYKLSCEAVRVSIKETSDDVRIHIWNDRPERTHAEVLALLTHTQRLIGE